MNPLAIDLFCGLGGWTEGLLPLGWDVIGFDIERHQYGEAKYPAQLVLQDVLTLHGSQFKDAALIVASPPCQEFSYMAMPWSLAKDKARRIAASATERVRLTALFDACFRIQREACEAAGRHIPLIVENVRGAQPWVGRSRWNFGSFHLWGDVPALMPIAKPATKNTGGSWFGIQDAKTHKPRNDPRYANNPRDGFKTAGMNWSDRSKRGQDFTRIAGQQNRLTTGRDALRPYHGGEGIKTGGDAWFSNDKMLGRAGPARHASKSNARKAASAHIAKIPFALSSYIAQVFHPEHRP